MASKVKVVLNRAGMRELLRSDAVENMLQGYANAALGRLGDGYEASTRRGKNRCNASVAAVTYKAKRDNLNNNTIQKAVRG